MMPLADDMHLRPEIDIDGGFDRKLAAAAADAKWMKPKP
jgi:hypothetical protein